MKKWKIAGLMVCALMIATLFPAAAEPDSLDSSENERDDEYQGELIYEEEHFEVTYIWGIVWWDGKVYIFEVLIVEYRYFAVYVDC